jgi:hypothetical protein
MRALAGLKGLGLMGHNQGQTRYLSGLIAGKNVTVPGRAPRFWATPKLIALAKDHGIEESNINSHFVSDLPARPLLLRGRSSGTGP